MTILVTGGAGYIGSHTCVELLKEGHDVIILDNYCNSSPACIGRIARVAGREPVSYAGDVRDGAALDSIFSLHRIDWVIHFAGLKAVGESCKMPIEYYDNNVCGTISLVRAMQRHGCKRIIFSSSATVYGVPERLPLDETCRTGGTTNPYGTGKLFQERILEDVYAADGSWTVVLLRYFNPVGAHESGLLGEDPRGVPNNLVPYIARVAAGGLGEIRVFGNDYPTADGTGVRDYIHVTDLAKGHTAALGRIEKSGVYVYNLGTGRGYSVLEVIAAFGRACGKELPYRIVPRREGDIAECYADPSKAERELGWKAQLGLDEMCASVWNWQRKNPDGYGK